MYLYAIITYLLKGVVTPTSLTRGEFLERLENRRKILQIAIGEDLKEFKRSPNSPTVYVQYEGGKIEIHEFIGKLANDYLFSGG